MSSLSARREVRKLDNAEDCLLRFLKKKAGGGACGLWTMAGGARRLRFSGRILEHEVFQHVAAERVEKVQHW
jgi:hypothetical protein